MSPNGRRENHDETPLGKTGRNISRQKYDMLKKAILSVLKDGALTHTELLNQLNKDL
jgi:hypothetical protein